MSFNENEVVSIKENAYRIHFWGTSKDKAINMMKKSIDISNN